MVNFNDVYHVGKLKTLNPYFAHYMSSEFYFKYDANFIQFKQNPSLKELHDAEKYLEDFQRQNKQAHMKFYLPENERMKEDVLLYLYQQFYTIGCQELYEINPKDYIYKENKEEILVQEVTEENWKDYLLLQESFDKDFGEEYVSLNKRLHQYHFQAKDTFQFLAYDRGQPAGSLQVFVNQQYVEIDSVGVLPAHRLKGIAAQLQLEVMKCFKEYSIILVADSNDTPKHMYRKEGYKKIAFRYEIMKLL